MTADEAEDGPTPLAPRRAHEAYGAAARAFAAAQAAWRDGPVVWIQDGGGAAAARESLDGFGLAALFDPGRLILARVDRPENALWAMEEALRSGAAALVVAETRRRPSLTTARRLQLAAEAAAHPTTGLALLLDQSPQEGGGGAMETRWRAEPAPAWSSGDAAARWRWTLVKNKRGALGEWVVAAADLARRRGRASGAERVLDGVATHPFDLDAAAWRGAASAA